MRSLGSKGKSKIYNERSAKDIYQYYLDKDDKLKTIEGVVCAITHTIASDYTKTTYIKLY